MTKNVYILTWCDRIENLYGTTMVFNTLRVGFPTAEIHVVDNASIPGVRPVLRQYAQECNANFTRRCIIGYEVRVISDAMSALWLNSYPQERDQAR